MPEVDPKDGLPFWFTLAHPWWSVAILNAWCRQRQRPFFDLLLQGDLGFDAN